jgi:hypothetical protein
MLTSHSPLGFSLALNAGLSSAVRDSPRNGRTGEGFAEKR